MTVTGAASQPSRALPPGPPRQQEQTLSVLCYLGAIFLGPVPPLIVYLRRRRDSPFVRRHAAQALNVALTWLLYAVSGAIAGALLALSSVNTTLAIMVPVTAAAWLIMLAQLIRGAVTASRGGFREMPAWICSPLVR